MQHTPRPWNSELYAYSQGTLDNWRIFSSHASDVPCVQSCGQIAIVNAETDARLITAAPDLLAQLEWLVEVFRDTPAEPELAEAERLIAQARGEA